MTPWRKHLAQPYQELSVEVVANDDRVGAPPARELVASEIGDGAGEIDAVSHRVARRDVERDRAHVPCLRRPTPSSELDRVTPGARRHVDCPPTPTGAKPIETRGDPPIGGTERVEAPGFVAVVPAFAIGHGQRG